MPRTTQTITFSLPPVMARRIENLIEKEGKTRSEFMREALRRYIEQQELNNVLRYGAMKAAQKGIKQEEVENIIDAIRK